MVFPDQYSESNLTRPSRTEGVLFESIRVQTADSFEVLCRLLPFRPGSAQPQHPPASLHRVRAQSPTDKSAFASSAPQHSPRQYAHLLGGNVSRDFFQVSTSGPELMGNNARYKCNSRTIRK